MQNNFLLFIARDVLYTLRTCKKSKTLLDMNVAVATLIADFLRNEIIHGREEIPRLRIEMRDIKRAIINCTVRSMTVQIETAEDRAWRRKEEARFNAIKKEIEFIGDTATLATLMIAIKHDNYTKNVHFS